MDNSYFDFLMTKSPSASATGISKGYKLNSTLFDFQAHCVEFALKQGRSGCFLDTGLGKTFVQLEFCRVAVEHTNAKALILTPLAVAWQIKAEADKIGVGARVIRDHSDVGGGINICNYDRLDRLDLADFDIVALDESSILKSFTGKTTQSLISSLSHTRFRIAATATPAPNDHMELGNHAEFLGVMPSVEMLVRFFINDASTGSQKWRLKAHGRAAFWDWMASWSRMAANPDDLGFSGDAFVLPDLNVTRHKAKESGEAFSAGQLFATAPSATTLHDIKRNTISARADVVGELAVGNDPVVVWCDTNYEADSILRLIPDAVDVRGSLSISEKEERLRAFSSGEARVIVTKPSIAGFGLNWQHCAKMIFAGRSFSYESYYQSVRRCWRFGQQKDVAVHIVVARGEDDIGAVIDRKAADHNTMKREMAAAMSRSIGSHSNRMMKYDPAFDGGVPEWLSA